MREGVSETVRVSQTERIGSADDNNKQHIQVQGAGAIILMCAG